MEDLISVPYGCMFLCHFIISLVTFKKPSNNKVKYSSKNIKIAYMYGL